MAGDGRTEDGRPADDVCMKEGANFNAEARGVARSRSRLDERASERDPLNIIIQRAICTLCVHVVCVQRRDLSRTTTCVCMCTKSLSLSLRGAFFLRAAATAAEALSLGFHTRAHADFANVPQGGEGPPDAAAASAAWMCTHTRRRRRARCVAAAAAH